MQAYLLYITCKDETEAQQIARAVVQERLAACANIPGSIQSIYQWKEAIVEDTETLLYLKTSQPQLQALIKRVAALHSYEVPCIEAFPIAAGHQPYIHWIYTETEANKAAE